MITIPDIGTYDSAKPLHEQEQAVQDYIYGIMATEPARCEGCETRPTPKHDGTPLERFRWRIWEDVEKGIELRQERIYNYSAMQNPRAFMAGYDGQLIINEIQE